MASENVIGRQDLGRGGPAVVEDFVGLLDAARLRWTTGPNVRQLRRDLLEILRRLEDG